VGTGVGAGTNESFGAGSCRWEGIRYIMMSTPIAIRSHMVFTHRGVLPVFILLRMKIRMATNETMTRGKSQGGYFIGIELNGKWAGERD
jgi:hypothetical protein